jgi:hypothetical protein
MFIDVTATSCHCVYNSPISVRVQERICHIMDFCQSHKYTRFTQLVPIIYDLNIELISCAFT